MVIWLIFLVGLGGLCHSQETLDNTTTEVLPTESRSVLAFVEPMKNYSKVVGDSLKIRCVARGQPPVIRFKWFKNEAPLEEERGRIRIRSKTGSGGDSQWSRVRFTELETMDMGFYRCEATNGFDTIKAESVVKIHPGNKRKGTSYWSDDYDTDDNDYDENTAGLIPESFPLDLDASLDSNHRISGLPSHIEFQGRAPDDFPHAGGNSGGKSRASTVINGNVPSLKPNERAGMCQRYTGSVCRQHLGSNFIFVSQGLTQDYIEKKLQASLQVISNSPELSKECAKYAIPAICLSTLPLCDTQTQKPRKVCSYHIACSSYVSFMNKNKNIEKSRSFFASV